MAPLLRVLLLAHLVSQAAPQREQSTFLLEDHANRQCLAARDGSLKFQACDPNASAQKWFWGSGDTLVSSSEAPVDRGICLTATGGLKKGAAVSVERCSVAKENQQKWHCRDGDLVATNKPALMVMLQDGQLLLSRTSQISWRIHGSAHDPCSVKHEAMFTLFGTGHGRPCHLPYRYKGVWYVDCTTVDSSSGALWCGTTLDYARDQLWGYCPTPLPAEQEGCPQHWMRDTASRACVQVNGDARLTWHEARASCAKQGAELLSFAGECEARYFSGVMLGKESVFWTGLNTLNPVGGWQWSDGTPLIRVHWEAEPPKSENEGSCVVMNPESYGAWKPMTCMTKLPYICYRRHRAAPNASSTGPSLPTPAAPDNSTCPRGWSAHGASCFSAVPTARLTWHEARAACTRAGAELARLATADEHDFVSTRLAPEDDSLLWIGLSALGPGAPFAWSDGSPVTLTVWDRFQPSRGDRSPATCVYLAEENRNWSDAPCNRTMGYVCRRGTVADGVQPTDSPDCQHGWVKGPHSCYWVGPEKVDSFKSASDTCRHHDAALVSITSSFEQAFVHSLLGDAAAEAGAPAWLGLSSDADDPEEFRWASGETIVYSHWGHEQPGEDGRCVTMNPEQGDGRWSAGSCSGFPARVVCEAKLRGHSGDQGGGGGSEPTPTATGTLPPCAHGWVSKDNLPSCYQVNHMEQATRQTWRVAREHCRVQGADLLSVQSVEERSFIDDYLEESQNSHSLVGMRPIYQYDYTEESDSSEESAGFWIGANQLNPDDNMAWSDGSPLNRQILRFPSSETEGRCGVVIHQYMTMWSMEACDFYRSWICKVAKGKRVNPMSTDMFDKENVTADGWYPLGTRDVFFSRNVTATFAEARRECRRGGGDLAMARSSSENRELLRIAAKTDVQEIWIGLQMTKGVFGWIDGSPVNFSNWASFEPNNYALEEYCGTMAGQTGQWNDRNCGARIVYMCQRGNGTQPAPTPPTTAPPTGGCPPNWLTFGSKCYLIRGSNSSEHVNWDSANLICHSRGGHLVTVQSSLEQAFLLSNVLSLTNKHLFIGLTDRNKMDEYLWTENLPLSYSNWAIKEPARTYSHDCVVMDPFTGKWMTISCYEQSGFICQRFRDPLFLAPPPTPASRQRHFGGLSYWVAGDARMTWARATEVCAAESALLPHVTDPTQQAFLTVLASGVREPVWLGLHAQGNQSEDRRSSFVWAQGERVWYDEWAPGEPLATRDCGVVALNGSWASEQCDAKRRVICQSHLAERTPEHGRCPEEPSGDARWIAYRGHCYSIHSAAPKSWPIAVRHCMELRSSMVSIHDMEENKFLMKMALVAGSEGIWTGLFKVENGQRPAPLYWQDDSPVSFTNWNWGEPDGGTERCIELLTGGRWNDKSCSMAMPYVCKKPQVNGVTAAHSGGAVHPAGVAAIVLCVLLVAAGLCALAVRASHTCGLWALPCVPYSGVMFAASRDSTTDSGPKMLINEDECNEQL